MGNNESRTLWISVAAGLFATFLLYSYSQEKKAEYDKKFGSSKRVVVAVRDIGEMETIDDSMLDTVERPVDFIEPSAINDTQLAVGQVASSPIKKGEQILSNKLLTPGPDTGISLQVAPGKRAVTLPVDEIRGVAKLIRPGDRIDIIAALDVGKGVQAKREVSIILQDVTVLATGINVVNNIPRAHELDSSGKNINEYSLIGDTKYTTITVEASLKEAQDLIYILSTSPGNLYYTLRNPNDRAVTQRLPSSTVESVLGKPMISFEPPQQIQQPIQLPQQQPQQRVPQNVPRKRNSFQRL